MKNWLQVLWAVTSIYLTFAQGFTIRTLPGNFYRNKRTGTTVCVEIKPNGGGNHEPYFMCKGSQFPQRQQNVPGLVPANGDHHQHHFGEVPNANIPLYYPNIPQQQFMHAQPNYQPYYTPMAHSQYLPIMSNQFQTDTKQSSTNIPQQSGVNTPNYQAATMMPGNKALNSNLKPSKTLPIQTLFEEKRQEQQQPVHDNPTASLAESQGTQQYDNQNAYRNNDKQSRQSFKEDTQNNKASDDQAIPYTSPAHFQALLDDEVLGAPNLEYSPEEMLPFHNMYTKDETHNSSKNQQQEEANSPTHGSMHDEPRFAPPPANNVKEMMLRQLQEQQHIPPHYLHDPVLRTFYSIDDNPTAWSPSANHQQMPGLKHEYQNNPITPSPSPSQSSLPPCPISDQYGTGSFMETLENPYTRCVSGCGNYPFNFQPIFIAVPWHAVEYFREALAKMQPTLGLPGCEQQQQPQSQIVTPQNNFRQTQQNCEGCPRNEGHPNMGQPSLDQSNLDHSSFKQPKSGHSYSAPPIVAAPNALDTNNNKNTTSSNDSSEEVVTEQNPSDTDIQTNNDEPQLGIALQSGEAESEDNEGEVVDKNDTTKLPPTTTKKTFKTMMHSAKLHAKMAADRYGLRVNAPSLNKRQIATIQPVNASNYKRQYVRKLDKMYI